MKRDSRPADFAPSRSMRQFAKGATIAAAVLFLGSVVPTQATVGSIFDDDWMTGKPADAHPATAPAVPPAPPPVPPAPVAPPETPVVPPPSAPAPVEPPIAPSAPLTPPPVAAPAPGNGELVRRPVPPPQDLERSRVLLKETFAAQLANRTPAARYKLAETLLAEAAKAADNPSDQFALFGGAVNAARESASLRLVVTAVDSMSRSYLVDARQAKLTAALSIPLKAETPEKSRDNVLIGLELIQSWIASDEVGSASRLCGMMHSLAAGDPALITIVQKRQQELDLMRVAHDRVAPMIEKLKSAPDDAAANTAVGEYRCFYCGDWPTGLTLLAKGKDPETKQLAADELAGPKGIEAQIKLADGWWTLSHRQSGATPSAAMRVHAGKLYAACTAAVSPLQRTKIDKRIAEGDAANAPNIATAALVRDQTIRMRITRLQEFEDGFRGKAASAPIPVPIGEPLAGDLTWSAAPAGHALAGEILVGFNGGNHEHKSKDAQAKVAVDPGYHLEGGSVLVSNGSLDLRGEADNPIILRQLHIGCELTGNVKAAYVIFDNCTFSKEGPYGWIGAPSSKFAFDHCLLLQSNFKGLGLDDYGIRLDHCTFAACKFPARNAQPKKGEDSSTTIHHAWSHIADSEFLNCELSASAFWMTQNCNFAGCKVTDTAIYFSQTDEPVTLGFLPGEGNKILADLKDHVTSSGKGHIAFTAAEALYPTEAFPKLDR